MSYQPPHATASASIDADLAVPRWHCTQQGERMTIMLIEDTYPVSVDVTGTRAQIVAWANAVRAEAIKGEEGD